MQQGILTVVVAPDIKLEKGTVLCVCIPRSKDYSKAKLSTVILYLPFFKLLFANLNELISGRVRGKVVELLTFHGYYYAPESH